MEVLAQRNDGGSRGGIQHHDGGVASSEHCSVEPVAVGDIIICVRQRSFAGSPGGVSDAGKGRG
jgi:hypothetical protein